MKKKQYLKNISNDKMQRESYCLPGVPEIDNSSASSSARPGISNTLVRSASLHTVQTHPFFYKHHTPKTYPTIKKLANIQILQENRGCCH
jgi:hypothetical protein